VKAVQLLALLALLPFPRRVLESRLQEEGFFDESYIWLPRWKGQFTKFQEGGPGVKKQDESDDSSTSRYWVSLSTTLYFSLVVVVEPIKIFFSGLPKSTTSGSSVTDVDLT
jgi:hypothetical protein